MRLPLIELTEEQAKCLASVLRQDIVFVCSRYGPLTVVELAELLGKPAKSLYYQVRILCENGLLQVVGERPSGKNKEAIYDTVADAILLPRSPSALKVIELTLEGAAKEVAAMGEPRPGLRCERQLLHLSAEEAELLANEARELVGKFQGKEGRRFAVTVSIVPLAD